MARKTACMCACIHAECIAIGMLNALLQKCPLMDFNHVKFLHGNVRSKSYLWVA